VGFTRMTQTVEGNMRKIRGNFIQNGGCSITRTVIAEKETITKSRHVPNRTLNMQIVIADEDDSDDAGRLHQ